VTSGKLPNVTLKEAKQDCGAGTQIPGSGSSSRHLNILALAMAPTSRNFGSGPRTIWSTEN